MLTLMIKKALKFCGVGKTFGGESYEFILNKNGNEKILFSSWKYDKNGNKVEKNIICEWSETNNYFIEND